MIALSALTPDAKKALKWFRPRLQDENTDVILAALKALVRWSKQVVTAGNDVERLTSSKSEAVITAALDTLCLILPPEQLPASLARLLFNEPKSATVSTSYQHAVLTARYADDSATIVAVKPLLKGTTTAVRLEALHRLSGLGSKAEPALSEIAACLGDTDNVVQFKALEVMSTLGGHSASQAPAVLALYAGHADSKLADKAIQTIIAMGAGALETLAKAYRTTTDEKTANLILETIENHGAQAKGLVPNLLDAAIIKTHPHGTLHIAHLDRIVLGKADPYDPISSTIAKIGGDPLAVKLLELTEFEIKNVLGQDIKFLRAKLGAQPAWAIEMLEAMDPASVGAEQRTLVYQRLLALENYDLSRVARKSAKAALAKWKLKPG